MTSIIIPYKINRGYLDKALKSAYNQGAECEVIPIQGPYNKGKNINDVLKKTEGEFIKILDEDDTLPPTAIEDLEMGIANYDFVCGDAENSWYDENLTFIVEKWTGKIVTLEEMLEKNCIHGGTTLYRKKALLEIGGWNEALWTAEEYDLHLRLLKNGYKLGYVPKVVYHYRIHGLNKSMNLSKRGKQERQDFIKQIQSWYSTKQ